MILFFPCATDDFKPASVDTNQESRVIVGEDGGVEVTVPHVQVSRIIEAHSKSDPGFHIDL